MSRERFQKAIELFRSAQQRAPDERKIWLEHACRDDDELREAVQRMLEADDEPGSPAEAPAIDPDGSTLRRTYEDVSSQIVLGGSDDHTPRTIGPWKIMRELGRGGMGVVYAAERDAKSFRQRAALKVLKRGLDTEDVLRRFEQERQLLALLNHAGIARLYDAAETREGMPYYAMEYVDGTPLSAYCDEHRLSIDSRLELFAKVCRIVHYAHQNLIVHRDLKPGNILVNEKGDPKLLDFGIAKVINPDFALNAAAPTARDRRIMTPEYASPEQVRGRPITTASDVYSLGVILYELVTGRRPLSLWSRAREEVERRICEELPERPSDALSHDEEEGDELGTGTLETASRLRDLTPHRLRRRVMGDLDNIILKALRKEPQRRYTSAEALANDVDSHLAGLPVTARPDTTMYRTGKFIRRHRVGVTAAAVVTLALSAGVVGTTSGWKRAQDEQSRAEVRFEQVQALAHTLTHGLHDEIAPLDGSLPARGLLVATALDYLKALSDEAGDDLELRANLASTYDRVGDLQAGLRNPNLGEIEAARQSYATARTTWLELVEADPTHADWRRGLAGSHRRFGDLHRRQGEYGEALAAYQAELEIVEALHAEQADDVDLAWDLSAAFLDVGNGQRLVGRLDEAIEANERAVALRVRVLADPVLPQGEIDRKRRGLAVTYNRLSGNYFSNGDMKRAFEMVDRAIGIREMLVASDPDNGRWKRDLANTWFQKVRLLEASRQFDEAIALADKSLAIMRHRLDQNPTDARSIVDLARAHNVLARLEVEHGDAELAREHARAIEENLAPYVSYHRNEPDPAYLLGTGVLYGAAAARTEEDPQAIRRIREAIVHLEAACAMASSRAERWRALARAHRTLAEWLAEDGRPDEAIEALGAARQIYAELPADDVARRELALVDERLAELSN